MPSIITHHLFAKDVFKKLPEKIKKSIDLKYFLLFSQSFDNLFYYKFLTPWLGKDIRTLGEEAQKEKVNLYFKNILEEIEIKHLENNKEIIAYLYGSLCHYVLDYHCHPFIFYYSGVSYNKKYRGLHEKMEVNLDAQLYKIKTNKDLYKENLADIVLPKLKFQKELKETINNIFYKTFKKENMGQIYEESIITGNFLIKYGVTDHTGLKKILYTIKDYLTPNNRRKYQYLSFHVTNLIKEYLNDIHEPWHNPAKKEIISNESFEELYEKALEKTINLIKILHVYLKTKEKKEEVLKDIGNNSYLTGLPCTEQLTLRFFKF